MWVHLRIALRLRSSTGSLESTSRARHTLIAPDTPVNNVRFEQNINGRAYVLEAWPVGRDRWRAQIVGVPGTTTALMPFYGTTADEAAAHLSAWLTRAANRQTA